VNSQPKTQSTIRPLSSIAREIQRNWIKPYFGAVPYLHAMLALDSIDDSYGADSGQSIVMYFLSNANTWRGSEARRIKAELQQLLKRSHA
jgi:hypothetical protein